MGKRKGDVRGEERTADEPGRGRVEVSGERRGGTRKEERRVVGESRGNKEKRRWGSRNNN